MSKIKFCFIFLILKIALLNEVPDSYDWREKNIIGNVQSQGLISWLNPLTGMLESLYAIGKGNYVYFSKQMLLDCVPQTSDFIGDQIAKALNWISRNGIVKDSEYPYTGVKGTCKATKYIDMKVTKYRKLGPNANEEEMKQLLYENGPFIVLLNSRPLITYSKGILYLDETKCPSSGIDQAFLLVGYGSSAGIDYWIIKGSLGKIWGEKGYFRIIRGKGACGINQSAFIPFVEFE